GLAQAFDALPDRGPGLAVLARQGVARDGAGDQALQQGALGAHRRLVARRWAGGLAGNAMPGVWTIIRDAVRRCLFRSRRRRSPGPVSVAGPGGNRARRPAAPQHATICEAAASKV